MEKEYNFQIKWSVSRARDTNGYNICSLWDMWSGKKVSSTCGGGYDMLGTVLGNWIQDNFQDQLKTWDEKTIKEHYGVFRGKERIHCDGACGFSSMEKILHTMGYRIHRHGLDKKWNKQVWHIYKD